MDCEASRWKRATMCHANVHGTCKLIGLVPLVCKSLSDFGISQSGAAGLPSKAAQTSS